MVAMYFEDTDKLSLLLRSLNVSAQVYAYQNYCGQWSVDTSVMGRTPFHYIVEGNAWLHIPDRRSQMIKAGELVILPHNTCHLISNNPEPNQNETSCRPNTEQQIQLLCGYFEALEHAIWPLLGCIDQVLIIDTDNEYFKPILSLLLTEAKTNSLGQNAILDHLANMLFIGVLRRQIDSDSIEQGVLAALFDPQLQTAIMTIHQHPEYHFSVQSLAELCFMGRSAFAKKFNDLVGIAVMAYISRFRMRYATQLLQQSTYSVAVISEKCGYGSEAAFRKAYKQVMGFPPGQVRVNSFC